jgi:PAS domain S-box-containing protein
VEIQHPGSAQPLEAEVAQLRAENAKLRASLVEAQALVRIAPAFFGYLSPTGNVLSLNERSLHIIEATREQVVGLPIWEGAWWHGLPAAAASLREAVAAAGRGEGSRFVLEYQATVDPVPTQRWATVDLAPMRDEAGAVARLAMSAVDITPRKVAQALQSALLVEAEQSRATAERASRAKYEFLALLGHELRNPLAPIMTALHLMRLRAGDVVSKERAVIEAQAQHLVHLVDDLLDVARITRGKVELKRRRGELSDVVAHAIELASPSLEQRQHVLKVDVAAAGLRVDADPVRLAQALSHLITNAARYTHEHGQITVSARHEGEQLVVRVQDTGIGISPEMLPRVFEMFVQERQPLDRVQGGLGLGLAIVRSLVELHGGAVEGRSEGHGLGSEFIVRLPAVEPPGEARPVTAPELQAPARDASAPLVLIVDDNEDAAEMMGMALELSGHATRVAHDGPAGLKLAAESPPAVALLDIGLPAMDGYELARRLRDQAGGRKLVLIAVTGYGQEEDRERSQQAGFDAHMVKPIDLGALSDLIKQLMAEPG